MAIKDRNLTVGTKLIGKYHKQQHTCEVIQGEGDKLRYKLEDGREFKSSSAAGMAVTGHPCDGWVFWSLAPAETAPTAETLQTETNPDASTPATENTNPTGPGSVPAQKPEDALAMDTAPVAPETVAPKTSFKRTPNQKGVSEGMTRWYCQTCGESFLAPYGEIPAACPQGHKS